MSIAINFIAEPLLANPPAKGIVEYTSEQAVLLTFTNKRFQAMHGIQTGIHPKQVLLDRTSYYHLYDPVAKSDLELTDENRIRFLTENTGISENICASWVYRDFLDGLRSGDIALDVDVADMVWEAYESALEYAN